MSETSTVNNAPEHQKKWDLLDVGDYPGVAIHGVILFFTCFINGVMFVEQGLSSVVLRFFLANAIFGLAFLLLWARRR
jgi:hypothetical protein